MTMTYQYEKFVLSLLTSLAIKKKNKGYYVISDEVEEVYRKARAFDEMKKSVIQIKSNYKDNEERINKFITREIEYIMDREDQLNDRP